MNLLAKETTKPHHFQPGQIVNPGGRPRAIASVRDLARQHTTQAIAALVKNLTCGNPSAENVASMALLDRGWGKPEQHVIADVTMFDAMDPDKRLLLDQLLEVFAARLEAQEQPVLPTTSCESGG